MTENAVRPPAVPLIAVAQFFTGLVVLFALLACGAGFITVPNQDAASGLNWPGLFGVAAIILGLVAGGAMLWVAWAFFQLNPRAYHFVHAEASRPQFLLIPLFRSRLEEHDLRSAFGIEPDANASDAPGQDF